MIVTIHWLSSPISVVFTLTSVELGGFLFFHVNRECVKLLVGFQTEAAETKLRAVYRKFSSPDRGSVSLFPPAKSLLAAAVLP